ncbi:hypothetical protein [Moraxella sp. K127]|nr:hypothetical protein [Moraxella sp. K127]
MSASSSSAVLGGVGTSSWIGVLVLGGFIGSMAVSATSPYHDMVR